ncbi:MAG: hypothetical protein R8K50_05075 [Mariprofundus sp.]
MRNCRNGYDACCQPDSSVRVEGIAIKRAHLFRHPIGVFPAGARWYLAFIAMLALLAIGMHLSVQQQAQQQAETLIQQWGREAGVEVGNVRYHLLRNGLALQGIRIQRGEDSLVIKHILVHANPQLLTGEHPRIGNVMVSGVEAILHAGSDDPGRLLRERHLLQLWQVTRDFSLSDGKLSLYVQSDSAQVLDITAISLHLKTRDGRRKFISTGRLNGGLLQGSWTRSEGQGRGDAAWQQLDATLLSAAFGLYPMAGQLSGTMHWKQAAIAQENSVSIDGQVQLLTSAGNVRSHRLHWQAGRADGQWTIDMNADAWPLRPWADLLPHPGGRQLMAGQLDGALRWQGDASGWIIDSDHGTLYDITYATDQAEAWYWSRILYKQARIDTAAQHLSVAQVDLNDSRLVLDTQALPAAADHWQIDADRVVVNNMMLALSLPHGRVILPELSGHGRWPARQRLSFDLETQPSEAATSWRLRGLASPAPGLAGPAEINVVGHNIALQTLRALLPFRVDEGRGTSLAGSTDLDVDITVRQGQWQAKGRASARDVNLLHSDSVWSAAKVSTLFGPVGMGLELQHIGLIKASDWRYVTALKPLSATIPAGDASAGEAMALPWWMAALRENHYQIDALDWQGGSLSVGREAALWAENINVDIRHIQPGRWAETTIEGIAGDSPFTVKGEWDLFSSHARMRGRAHIEDALPFFLSDWIGASGMPQLIRGRLSAAITLTEGDEAENWQAAVNVGLKRGRFDQQETPSDPMLARTGYKTVELLAGLQDKQMAVRLNYTATGRWSDRMMEKLGEDLQQAMVSAMAAQTGQVTESAVHFETRVGLHNNKRLSLNERTRLLKVIKNMKRNSHMTIDLRPEWTGKALDKRELARIRQTQAAIGRYLSYRGIEQGRVFPVRPTASAHTNDMGSIWIETAR